MILRFIKGFFDVLKTEYGEHDCSAFISKVSPQSELDFLNICFSESSTKKNEIAIAIRNAIANLGKIEPKYIRAEAYFEDLDLLPFWCLCGDAGFSTTRFVEAIESELDIQFTEEQLRNSSVRDPDLNVNMKIYEFIREFCAWYDSIFIAPLD